MEIMNVCNMYSIDFFKIYIISEIRTHPRCKLYITGEPYVSATPEFVVNRKNVTMIVVEVCMF